VAAGAVACGMPGITALALLVVIATWSCLNGIMEIVSAIRLRKEINNEWLWILAGLVSIVFGVLVLIWPGAGALALIWWIGASSVFFGVMLIALAFRMRRWKGFASPAPGPA